MENSASAQHPSSRLPAFPNASVWIAWVWAVFLCWIGRREMLDDALIHLRYAAVLHERHFVSFDGIHPSYGVSSLLYVGLLALLRAFTQSPLLPKIVSVVAYAGLLAFAHWLSHINRLAVALIFVLVSPFAVRWLTDGMETSLAALLSMSFAALLCRKAKPVSLGLIALVLCLFRVDLTLIAGFGVLLLIQQREWARAAVVSAGSVLSLIFIHATMGHILPDTAIAKSGLPFLSTLHDIGRELLAAGSFGIGIIALWIASAAFARNTRTPSVIIANLPFPALVLLAAVRGQQIRGVRYLIWALAFSIVWNLFQTTTARQLRPIVLYGITAILILAWTIELPILIRVDRGRSQTLQAMERAHLDRLQGEGMTGDVGFIGYFSHAPICDLDGLVNGRIAAQKTPSQREVACLAANPDFLFLPEWRLAYFDRFYDLQSKTKFFNCGSVEFTNVGGTDRHWLLVRRTVYSNGCPLSL